MADTISKERRSWVMSRVRSTDTGPEMIVRSVAHACGYRFRLHRKDLPGKPDLVFPKHGAVVFVHGCFWHRHKGCKYATSPKTRKKFWEEKFRRNVERDAANARALRRLGWRVMIVWQCGTKDREKLAARLRRFLEG